MNFKYWVLILVCVFCVQMPVSANSLLDILRSYQQVPKNSQEKQATKSILVPASGDVKNNNPKEEKVDFGPYMSRMYHKIKNNWNPPKLSEDNKVVIYMEVENRGTLKVIKIKQSSGNKSFDDSVISAVKKSLPFESLPKGYNGNSIKVEYEFTYIFTQKIEK